MADFLVAGVSAAALLVAIVAVLRKAFKLDRQWTVVVVLILGQILSLGAWAAVRYPQFTDVWAAVVGGLVIALVAMGGFSGTKAAVGR